LHIIKSYLNLYLVLTNILYALYTYTFLSYHLYCFVIDTLIHKPCNLKTNLNQINLLFYASFLLHIGIIYLSDIYFGLFYFLQLSINYKMLLMHW